MILPINNIDESLVNDSIKEISALPDFLDKRAILIKILGLLDLTSLEGSDTFEKIRDLCCQARSYESTGLPNVAAVCVYPVFARIVKSELRGSDIKTACVAGAFPSGQSFLDVRLDEVKRTIDNGADEIDMVVSRGRYLEGDFQYVYDEIAKHKEVCGNVHLKVILETGELRNLSEVFHLSEIAISAGADFIKTSTGKISPAATPESFYVMLLAIKQHFEKSGLRVGVKPAGGISEPDIALLYSKILISTLGDEWFNKSLFRIGASRLTNRLADALLS